MGLLMQSVVLFWLTLLTKVIAVHDVWKALFSVFLLNTELDHNVCISQLRLTKEVLISSF